MKLILGANGQIARSLIKELPKNEFLFLVTSNQSSLLEFLKRIGKIKNYKVIENNYKKIVIPKGIKSIINCSGIGDPMIHNSKKFLLNDLGFDIDNQVLNYLEKNNNTHYFFMSTGGIYNAEEDYFYARHKRELSLNLDDLSQKKYYILKKITQETLHRSLKHLNIVNIRIFGFISEFINLNSAFFLAQIIKSFIDKKIFVTSKKNFLRDLISAKDLVRLISILEKKKINDTFDVFSNKPVTKKDILIFFEKKGLKLSINTKEILNLKKPKFISKCLKAKLVGFKKQYSSIENISNALENLVLYTNK